MQTRVTKWGFAVGPEAWVAAAVVVVLVLVGIFIGTKWPVGLLSAALAGVVGAATTSFATRSSPEDVDAPSPAPVAPDVVAIAAPSVKAHREYEKAVSLSRRLDRHLAELASSETPAPASLNAIQRTAAALSHLAAAAQARGLSPERVRAIANVEMVADDALTAARGDDRQGVLAAREQLRAARVHLQRAWIDDAPS